MQTRSKVWITIIIIIIVIIALIAIQYIPPAASSETESENIQGFSPNSNPFYKAEITLYAASWCPHCKVLAPEWDRFNMMATNKYPQLKITTIQCDQNNSICNSAGINGFPTIVLNPGNSQKILYNGPRNAEGIIAFIQPYM